MESEFPADVADRVDRWDELSRWERAELGRSIRRLGWSYGEIMAVIPVPKATLSSWCRDVSLSEAQKQAIFNRTASRRGIPRDTQRKRRQEVEAIRATAVAEVPQLTNDPLWLAGTVMYWAGGAKAKQALAMANSDPRALSLFITWVRTCLMNDAVFVLHLHLHDGNDEPAAKAYWEYRLSLPQAHFYRTFFKPPGTGHRKNHLPHGVLRVGVRRSTDSWHRVMGWIDGLGTHLSVSGPSDQKAILPSGR